MGDNRDDFTQKTIEVIASRVGYKCSCPNCRIETRGPHTNPEKKVSVGEAAHITAAAPGGARYDATLTKEQRKSAKNGIWMCRTHARLVDNDETNYSVELLKNWKAQAEYEQYCIINNKNNINVNRERYKEALRNIKSGINKINNIYIFFKGFFDENLSMYANFIEVNNKISEMWNLYGDDLSNAYVNLKNASDAFSNIYFKYELDLSNDLKKKINRYFQLTSFTYESDGRVGFYNNYYEKLFEMLVKNYDQIKKVKGKIDKIIEEEYNKIR